MSATPLVSICCITYNHASYIRKSLDGFLMQKTSFPVEILIHDDASTDGTADIIRDYAARFPDIVFPLFEEENQYSKPVHKHIDFYNYERARGKYVAYCEGDDYWTDPLKLQRQVDFLETHSDYSVCWHRYRRYYPKDNRWEDDRCGELFHEQEEGVDIDIATYFSGWYTQALTMVFRKSSYDLAWQSRYEFYRDEHEMYHLLTVGKGFLFGFYAGVYVIHDGGVYGGHDVRKQSKISCAVARELYLNNRSACTKDFYANSLQWAIYQDKGFSIKKFRYSWELFLISGNIRKFLRNLLR